MNIFINHWATNLVVIIFTSWALFADDIKMLSTTIEVDVGFSISIIFIQFCFLLEVLISSFFLEGYFLKFFFWLDIISILSMLLDIHWFYNMIIEELTDSLVLTSSSTKKVTNTSRIAKVSSRAIRVLRVVRLIRIVRIVKIYKISQNYNIKDNTNTSTTSKIMLSPTEERSKLGKKMSEATMKKVIILVLSMIFGIIIFNPNFYYQPITSMDYGIKVFNDYKNINDPAVKIIFDFFVSQHQNITSPILYANVYNMTYGDSNDV
jgi:hypothetical protein